MFRSFLRRIKNLEKSLSDAGLICSFDRNLKIEVLDSKEFCNLCQIRKIKCRELSPVEVEIEVDDEKRVFSQIIGVAKETGILDLYTAEAYERFKKKS